MFRDKKDKTITEKAFNLEVVNDKETNNLNKTKVNR